MMIQIKEPIWKYPRSVGLAEYKLGLNTEIEILYKTKDGEKLYPHIYTIPLYKATKYPKKITRGITLRIIPIQDLEIKKYRKWGDKNENYKVCKNSSRKRRQEKECWYSPDIRDFKDCK